MPFFTRPNFEDRQVVQYSGDTITLSGGTNISNLGSLQINAPILDFTGTTTASTIYTIAGVQGYVNYGQPSSFIVQPPLIYQSGSSSATTVDVTGYILGGMDSLGRVTWFPASYFLTGGTNTISGGTDFYVTGGTFDNLTGILTLDRQNGSVTIPGFSTGCTTTDFYVTGGTFDNLTGILTLDRQNGSVAIPGFSTGGTITSGPYIYGTGLPSIIPISGSNKAESSISLVLNGTNNIISGGTSPGSSIVNGINNYIYRNRHAFIGGGINNNIIKDSTFTTHNTIINGNNNTIYSPIEGSTNFIGNGLQNAISGNTISYGFIGNGLTNVMFGVLGASINYATLLNGYDNRLFNVQYGSILNGSSNLLRSSPYSTIINGDNNIIDTAVGHSVITSGKDNKIVNPGSGSSTLTYGLIGTGSGNTVNISTYSSINNGRGNSINYSTSSSVINGGFNLINDSDISTVINGVYNTIDTADYSTIINGTYNLISGFTGSTIIGGNNIVAINNDTTYVPYLNLNLIPANNDLETQVLVRNSTTGNVEYRNSTTLGGGVKELFFTPNGLNQAFKGSFYTTTCNSGTDPVYISGIIPYDFTTVVSIETIGIPDFTSVELTSLNCQYGQIGTQYSATTNTSIISPSYVINEFISIDVSSVFSGITSGDVFGFNIFQNNANLHVIGLKIKYT